MPKTTTKRKYRRRWGRGGGVLEGLVLLFLSNDISSSFPIPQPAEDRHGQEPSTTARALVHGSPRASPFLVPYFRPILWREHTHHSSVRDGIGTNVRLAEVADIHPSKAEAFEYQTDNIQIHREYPRVSPNTNRPS